MKAEHEKRTESMRDADAERVAVTFLARDFSNVGQTGGMAAQSIHAQSITLHHAAPVDPVTLRRQIQAVETIWKAIKALRKEFGDLDYADTIFTRDEFQRFYAGAWPAYLNHLREYRDDQAIVQRYERANATKVEEERLFVSYRVWNVYHIIRALHGRVAYLCQQSFKQASFRDWRLDSGVDQLLRAILPPNVVEQVKAQPVFGLKSAFEHLEEQFMAEANMR
jgi:hypothetical protein